MDPKASEAPKTRRSKKKTVTRKRTTASKTRTKTTKKRTTKKRTTKKPAPRAKITRELHVLLIGTLSDRHEQVQQTLQDLGWKWRNAQSGVESTRMFETDHFDLVLVDLLAGAERAVQAARHIRQVEASRWQPPTPMVGLGVRTREFDEQLTSETGFNGSLDVGAGADEQRQFLERRTSIGASAPQFACA